jgi:hypothetical protein
MGEKVFWGFFFIFTIDPIDREKKPTEQTHGEKRGPRERKEEKIQNNVTLQLVRTESRSLIICERSER